MERLDQDRLRRVGPPSQHGAQLKRLWAPHRAQLKRLWTVAVLALAGCAAPVTTTEPEVSQATDATLRYVVEARRGVLSVEITSERPLTGRWRFGRRQCAVETVRAGQLEVSVLGGGFELPAGVHRMRYVYELSDAMDRFGRGFRTGVGSASGWLVGGESYLARPAKIVRARPVEIRYTGEIPLLPWDEQSGQVKLAGADLFDPGFHTFGGRRHTIEHGERRFRLTILDGRLRVTDADVTAWIDQAARELLTLRSALPFPTTNVTIVPVAGGGVQFGQVLFSRPPSVAIYLGEHATREDLRGDWVAVHELSHLVQPRFRPRANWLSEGLATYYQEVARARSGRKTPAQVWSNVRWGVRCGQEEAGDADLNDLSQRMHSTHAYRAVYWGGALAALALDVELRRTTDGARCLDDVLAALLERGDSSVEEFAQEVDAQAGTPIYERVLATHLTGPALSCADGLLKELGIAGEEAIEAPLSALREAILEKRK